MLRQQVHLFFPGVPALSHFALIRSTWREFFNLLAEYLLVPTSLRFDSVRSRESFGSSSNPIRGAK